MTDLFNQPSEMIPKVQHNNTESDEQRKKYSVRWNRQNKLVFRLLMQGKELTTREAMITHNIADLVRRMADLKELGVEYSSEWVKGSDTRFMVWTMTPQMIHYNDVYFNQYLKD